MRFFKNSELVRKYGVSDKTVRNWIAASLEGKINLKLHEQEGKLHVTDSVYNELILKRLVANGRKYENHRSHKLVKPRDEFYRIFNHTQIIEISNSLEKARDLSWHYSYFGNAATYWNEYLLELYSSGGGNMITNTISTLANNYAYVDALTQRYERINIVNLCIGNNLAVRGLLDHVQAQGKLNRFIAVDISSDVLKISADNINKWFGGKVRQESYEFDLRYRWFGDVLAKNTEGIDLSKTINLVMLVAGPIVNFEYPEQVLRTIHDSMGIDDLLVISEKRDTQETRSFFDFNIQSDKSLAGFKDETLADLLNIEESFYTIEQSFDVDEKVRYMKLRLNMNVSVLFESGDFKKIVKLEKGDALFLWRSWHNSDLEITERMHDADFSVLQSSQSIDRQMLMTISKVKDKQDL